MTQEFPTVYGKAIIERDILYLRSFYLPFGETAFARIGISLLLIVIFVVQFFEGEDARRYVGIILWGLLLVGRLPEIYDHLFKRSYASRIPLHRIKSFSAEDDFHGLQTTVKLQLKNGRYKKILFRKLENQVPAFTERLSQYASHLQPSIVEF